MPCTEGYVAASDGAQVFVRTWEPAPDVAVKAVVHVVHGIGEHTARYARLADRFNQEGIVVVAHDQRGHGRTAEAPGSPGLGRIAAGPEGAVPRLVADLTELMQATNSARPGIPVIIVAHSFGTVTARICAGAGAGGVRLVGMVLTAAPARITRMMAPVLRGLTVALRKAYGDHGISGLPARLSFQKFQAHLMAVAPEERPNGWEWLNRDKSEVQKYIADPWCGIDMSVGFWFSAVPNLLQLQDPATYQAMPAGLPICLMMGEHDFGTIDDHGVAAYTHIMQEFTKAGKATPKVIVYPQARHELWVEINHEEVTADALAFISDYCLREKPRSKL